MKKKIKNLLPSLTRMTRNTLSALTQRVFGLSGEALAVSSFNNLRPSVYRIYSAYVQSDYDPMTSSLLKRRRFFRVATGTRLHVVDDSSPLTVHSAYYASQLRLFPVCLSGFGFGAKAPMIFKSLV